MKADDWQTLDSKITYQNPWVTFREDTIIRPTGKAGVFAVIDLPSPGVAIMAINDQQEVYLIKQYRYAVKDFSLEFPGGFTDNQDPLLAAQRELKEETGLTAKRWHSLGAIRAPLTAKNPEVYLFLAQEITVGPQPDPELMQGEGVASVEKIALNTLLELLENNQIDHATTVACISKAYFWLQKNGQLK